MLIFFLNEQFGWLLQGIIFTNKSIFGAIDVRHLEMGYEEKKIIFRFQGSVGRIIFMQHQLHQRKFEQ